MWSLTRKAKSTTICVKPFGVRGYKVKVLTLSIGPSNAWDCVQEIYDPITGNIDDQRVITFCKTVIANTGGGANSKGDPFWESSEENLFRVAVSYCAYIREKSLIEIYERRAKELLTQLPYITQEDEQSLIEIVKNPESAMVDRRRVVEYLAHSFYGDEEGDRKLSEWEEDAPTCNISDIYDALLHNDLDKWEANFKYVPLSHPAASAWAVFKVWVSAYSQHCWRFEYSTPAVHDLQGSPRYQ